MLIDTHAHLNDNRLLPEVDGIISSMKDDNLYAIVNVGYDRDSSEISYQLSQKYSDIFTTLGIHPHDSRLATEDDYRRFSHLAKDKKVVGIGEIGLDFYYNRSEQDIQKKVFVEQLELAHSLKLPVVIHIRDAYQMSYEILRDNKHLLSYGGVLHCYNGSLEMLKLFSRIDSLYFAYGGVITFANAKKKEIVKGTPLSRLLLETDCPYMTPVPHRGKINYPKYVNLVAQKVKEWIPNIDIEQVTTKNAKELFRKIL